MKKLIPLLSFLLFVSSYSYSQLQLGQTLFESSSELNSDNGIDVSYDGSVFSFCNPESGEVKVFELKGQNWVQKGETISRISGVSAVISDDGNTLFINELTRISVYRWDGEMWKASVNPGFDNLTLVAGGISTSSSGNRICISYDGSGNPLNGVGIHGVFEWKDSIWHSLGEPITFYGRMLHWHTPMVELSGDGSTVIIGYRSAPITRFGGMAEVYKYSEEEWKKVGETIQDSLDHSEGIDVSISYDGKVIATSGFIQTKVHKWNGQSWEDKGEPISSNWRSECNLKLDHSGNRLAFAEKFYSEGAEFNIGRIALLEYDGEKWTNIGQHVLGERSEDKFGSSMGLSSNGEVIVAASDPIEGDRQSNIKAFEYGVIPYSPITFISKSLNYCDFDRIAEQSKFNLESSNSQKFHYNLNSNSHILFSVHDSIRIKPIAPQAFIAIPAISIYDSITLISYKAIPGSQIKDTFCLIPLDLSTMDVQIDIIITQNAQPGFSFPVLLKYTNVGTKTVSGNVEFYFDEQIQTITSTNPRHDVLGANNVRWNYEDLLPLESREIELSFELNRPTDHPSLSGGDRLLYSAKVEPVDGDVNPHDNHTEAIVEVVNAYDPNDKRCMQGDTIRPESVGRPLTYVIRFENVGTAEAIDVRIRDIIDTTALDINTFEMINASHDGYMVQISNGNIIDFTFKDIYLPFDDEYNDGYVAFKMHTKKGLRIGDTVKNDAAIYFDFNYPVITNEAITMVAQETTGTINIHPQVELKAQPNPARDYTRVTAGAGIHRMDLFDPSGRHIRQQVYTRSDEKTRDFNTIGLSQGIYWLRVTTERGTGTISLIKE